MSKGKVYVIGLLVVIIELLLFILVLGNKNKEVVKEPNKPTNLTENVVEVTKQPEEEVQEEKEDIAPVELEELLMVHRPVDELSHTVEGPLLTEDEDIMKLMERMVNESSFQQDLAEYSFLMKNGITPLGYYYDDVYGDHFLYCKYVFNNSDITVDVYVENGEYSGCSRVENFFFVDDVYCEAPLITFDNGLPFWSRELAYTLKVFGWDGAYTTDWELGDELIQLYDKDGKPILNGDGSFIGSLISEESCKKYGIEFKGGFGE